MTAENKSGAPQPADRGLGGRPPPAVVERHRAHVAPNRRRYRL